MQTAHNTNCTTPQSYMSCLAPAAHHSAPSTAAPQTYFIRASCSMNICQKVPFFISWEGHLPCCAWFIWDQITWWNASTAMYSLHINVWTCHPEDRNVCFVQNIEGIICRTRTDEVQHEFLTPLFAMLLVKPLWKHLIKFNWMYENGLLLETNVKITESLWKWAASQGLYFVWGRGEQ